MVVVALLCASLQSVRTSSAKQAALHLLQRLCDVMGPSGSEVRLSRVAPYIVQNLGDESSLVRGTVVRILTRVLEEARSLPPADAKMSPQRPAMTD